MKYLLNLGTGALDDVETPKLGEKYFASAETDEIIKQINDQFGPGTLFPASEAPQPENPYKDFEDRNPAANGGMMIGGGIIAGQDMGDGRTGFSKPVILSPEMKTRIKNFETKTGEKYLNQKSWKQHDIRSGAWTGEGSQVKLTDQMKENIKEFEERTGKKYEDLDNQKKKALRDGKKVGVLPSKEEMKLKISVNNDGVPKFPNKKMEQKFIKDIKNKYKYPDGSLNTPDELKAKGLAERYPISERQVERATKYYRDKFNLKYPEGAGSSDAAKKRYKYLD